MGRVSLLQTYPIIAASNIHHWTNSCWSKDFRQPCIKDSSSCGKIIWPAFPLHIFSERLCLLKISSTSSRSYIRFSQNLLSPLNISNTAFRCDAMLISDGNIPKSSDILQYGKNLVYSSSWLYRHLDINRNSSNRSRVSHTKSEVQHPSVGDDLLIFSSVIQLYGLPTSKVTKNICWHDPIRFCRRGMVITIIIK